MKDIFFIILTIFSLYSGHAEMTLDEVIQEIEALGDAPFIDSRPAPLNRTFNSSVINDYIDTIIGQLQDPILAKMFNNCFPNTLDTTIFYYDLSLPDTFVITGDIKAMWSRDSMNQVLPYMPFATQDKNLAQLMKGLIKRQEANIKIDPYANSYNYNASSEGAQGDVSQKRAANGSLVDALPNPWVFERKFETDSLTSFLKLSVEYNSATNDTSFLDCEWSDTVETILQVYKDNQYGTNGKTKPVQYTFQRNASYPWESSDSKDHGIGFLSKHTGMIQSAFRPSDDACVFPFNIPGNAFISVYLKRTAELLYKEGKWEHIAKECDRLGKEISEAIYKHGVFYNKHGKQVFAFEVDGFGNYYIIDDGNIPSLLSLPYLGFIDQSDEIYQNTRAHLMSNETNPYFFKGTAGEGNGSPHTGQDQIWPMGIIMRAMTSNDDFEIQHCLDTLKYTTNGTYFMHESFNKDDPKDYTRSWFSWCNSLFGELIINLLDTKPHLVKKQ